MASVALSKKAVGSTVKLRVNGVAKEFIIVHQGKPFSNYDDSCNGTWLLMKDCYERRLWHNTDKNNYKMSNIHSYLNGAFLNLFDTNIETAIKEVKIPYVNGTGNSAVESGQNGLPCKIFLLSGCEIGLTQSDNQNFPVDGAKLSYFLEGKESLAQQKRIANLSGSAASWWLRSPSTNDSNSVHVIIINGNYSVRTCSTACAIRPALVLPDSLLVSDDGWVRTNTPPTITSSSGASGVNLGSKTTGFDLSYSVADVDGDMMTITEKLDGTVMRTFTTKDGTFNFDAVTAANFQAVLNGTHKIEITVNDGSETAVFRATFAKKVDTATITLKNPLPVSGSITVAALSVLGEIPEDAKYSVKVTNNANDTAPFWQDVTTEVGKGTNIVFKNHTCANGAAFNFKIEVSRGGSGIGGHITGITGAFQ